MNTSSALAHSTAATTMDVPLSSAPLKIALLVATGVSVHYALTPPHKAAPKTVVANKTLFERAVQWVTWCSKTMVCVMAISDASATYLAAYHPATSFPTCPHQPSLSSALFSSSSSSSPFTLPSSPLLTPSPLFIAGALAAILGNLLRQRCFRELGTLFTFEVTIHPDHKLVTTGPYSVVRHPSYTGVYLTLLGPSLMALARGSWIRECWLSCGSCASTSAASWLLSAMTADPLATVSLPSPGRVLVLLLLAFWTAKVWFALRSTNRRIVVEDRELHGVFGEVWEEYERRVPWKLVPWVY